MGSTIMVEFTPRTRTSRTGEPRENANTGECLGYGRVVRQGGCQRNRAVESSRLKEWLPSVNGAITFSGLCSCSMFTTTVNRDAEMDHFMDLPTGRTITSKAPGFRVLPYAATDLPAWVIYGVHLNRGLTVLVGNAQHDPRTPLVSSLYRRAPGIALIWEIRCAGFVTAVVPNVGRRCQTAPEPAEPSYRGLLVEPG